MTYQEALLQIHDLIDGHVGVTIVLDGSPCCSLVAKIQEPPVWDPEEEGDDLLDGAPRDLLERLGVLNTLQEPRDFRFSFYVTEKMFVGAQPWGAGVALDFRRWRGVRRLWRRSTVRVLVFPVEAIRVPGSPSS